MKPVYYNPIYVAKLQLAKRKAFKIRKKKADGTAYTNLWRDRIRFFENKGRSKYHKKILRAYKIMAMAYKHVGNEEALNRIYNKVIEAMIKEEVLEWKIKKEFTYLPKIIDFVLKCTRIRKKNAEGIEASLLELLELIHNKYFERNGTRVPKNDDYKKAKETIIQNLLRLGYLLDRMIETNGSKTKFDTILAAWALYSNLRYYYEKEDLERYGRKVWSKKVLEKGIENFVSEAADQYYTRVRIMYGQEEKDLTQELNKRKIKKYIPFLVYTGLSFERSTSEIKRVHRHDSITDPGYK